MKIVKHGVSPYDRAIATVYRCDRCGTVYKIDPDDKDRTQGWNGWFLDRDQTSVTTRCPVCHHQKHTCLTPPTDRDTDAAELARLRERCERLRRYAVAVEAVEAGVIDFDLHADAVEEVRLARADVLAHDDLTGGE